MRSSEAGRRERCRAAHVVIGAWFVVTAAACAPSVPPEYARHMDAARAAHAKGDHAEAAQHWDAASAAATNETDRAEADYRAATDRLRAGDVAGGRAALERLAKEDGPRSTRAVFDLAELEIQNGDVERGHAALKRAILRFPNSGNARGALRRRILHLLETQGSESAEADTLRLARAVAGSELEANALFERAKLLEARGAEEPAFTAYREVAERFPYPGGAYWDDATLRAAALARALGRREETRRLLVDMIAKRETSSLTGSYEKSYDQAFFALAELERDERRYAAARSRWLELYSTFPHSRLRDDALWAAAKLARREGDDAEACALAERFGEEQQESRFAACVTLLCPRLRVEARCAEYLQRDFEADMAQ